MDRRIRVLIRETRFGRPRPRGQDYYPGSERPPGWRLVYTGIRQTPGPNRPGRDSGSVDIVGLSSLSGAHNVLFPRLSRY